MNHKTLRYITHALETSLESDFERIKIGAVVVRRNCILGQAANTKRSHPRQYLHNIRTKRESVHHCTHAELGAIIRSRDFNLEGASIYIGRWLRDGRLGNCKPCTSCSDAIRREGFSNIYYTTEHGIEHIQVRN